MSYPARAESVLFKSVDLAVAIFILMEHRKLGMRQRKAEQLCFGIRGAFGNEGERRKNGSPCIGLSVLSTSSPRGGPCRISIKCNLKAIVLDDVCMSLLSLKLNQIEHFFF